MTINLHTLIVDIRDELGGVRQDIIQDEDIFREIIKANAYIQNIKDADYEDESFERETILALSSYFTYINYTSVMEQLKGELGFNSTNKTNRLKMVALMFMRQLSSYPINDDLTIDNAMFKMSGYGVGFTEYVW